MPATAATYGLPIETRDVLLNRLSRLYRHHQPFQVGACDPMAGDPKMTDQDNSPAAALEALR